MQRQMRLTIRCVLAVAGWQLGGCAGAVVQPASPPVGPAAPAPAPAPPPGAEGTPIGLPTIPDVDGPLTIDIVHPTPGSIRPGVDSVLVYGSVGTGRATLTINGAAIYVQPNGAFLAFLPRPPDDQLRFEAWDRGRSAVASYAYRPPSPVGETGPPITTIAYPTGRPARAASGADTVATGSEGAIGRPTPTGIYRWFLPDGARLILTGERADMVRVRLDSATEAWFPRGSVQLGSGVPATSSLRRPEVSHGGDWTDVRVPLDWAPFHIVATDSVLEVTLHGVDPDYLRVDTDDPVISLVEIRPSGPDAATVRIFPTRSVWGYKTFYDATGQLVVRVRPPPSIDRMDPLRGIRVLVDPGHPPGGAPGPTGLAEAEANLAIALRVAHLLRERGAEVLLSRSTDGEVALTDRVDLAVDWNADLLLSIHNNAFPEGANPFRRNGTSSYYFHPISFELARSLNDEIVTTTQIRDLGAIHGNLALVRPTWMPSVLTESLFMPIPEQESALRDPAFLDRLAAAHVRGIDRFLRLRADM